MTQEVFVETAWESAAAVRRQRDDRYVELRSTGLVCHREDLYSVDGSRVFVVRAVPAAEIAVAGPQPTVSARIRSNPLGAEVSDNKIDVVSG